MSVNLIMYVSVGDESQLVHGIWCMHLHTYADTSKIYEVINNKILNNGYEH